jgi:hypothetical protein
MPKVGKILVAPLKKKRTVSVIKIFERIGSGFKARMLNMKLLHQDTIQQKGGLQS